MPIKILSVDDSQTIRLVVGRAFSRFDCQMLEAANGKEGLARAASETPDLILLDLTMPVMDGMTMLTRLKEDHALKAIPVIMLTAESAPENILHLTKVGAQDYLAKPFKESELIERAGKFVMLRKKAAQSGGSEESTKLHAPTSREASDLISQ